jgi:SEC-C motif-containing protein
VFAICPCGTSMLLQECCGRFHAGAIPRTAEELMRSRYSAYALGLVDYIIDTTHKASPHRVSDLSRWREELKLFSNETKFEGLKILEFIDGARSASVTFRATLKHGAKDVSFTEKSAFAREGDRWFYKQGKFVK